MSKTQMLIVIFAFIAIVTIIVAFVIPYLKKKGVNTKEILDKTEQGLEDAGAVINVVGELKQSNALNILNIIREFALDATRGAQQLYISSQLSLDQRKQVAKDAIINGLKIFSIPVTPNIEKLIDIVIERMVFDSKTDAEKKVQEQNTLQSQVSQLQNEKAELQTSVTNTQQELSGLKQENSQLQASIATSQQQVTELQQKIAVVQNTVK